MSRVNISRPVNCLKPGCPKRFTRTRANQKFCMAHRSRQYLARKAANTAGPKVNFTTADARQLNEDYARELDESFKSFGCAYPTAPQAEVVSRARRHPYNVTDEDGERKSRPESSGYCTVPCVCTCHGAKPDLVRLQSKVREMPETLAEAKAWDVKHGYGLAA
jgi:hypothetical protein